MIVARQNGKTTICVVLAGFWMCVLAVPLILGTSTKLDYAKESWDTSVKVIERASRRDDPDGRDLARLIPRDRHGAPKWTRKANGEQTSWVYVDPDNPSDLDVSRYKIATADASGGRSLTIHRLICDELREHHDYSAWSAAEPACSPMDAQIWPLSNAGDARSVVLNDLRAQALEYIETGQGDYRVGIAEWSMSEDLADRIIDGQPVTDEELGAGLAQANPRMGRGLDSESLFLKARAAIAAGGEKLTYFMTEYACVNVQRLSPAIDPTGWRAGNVPGELGDLRRRLGLVFDIAPDDQHATLAAAAELDDGRVRGEIVAAWDDPDKALRDLPAHIARIKPRAFGWLPEGPAAGHSATLRKIKVAGVDVQEIRTELPDVCMGLAALVKARRFLHSGQTLLTTQAENAERRKIGERWVFARSKDSETHVDGLYAVAGAAHLARTGPPPPSDAMPTPLGHKPANGSSTS